MADLDVATAHLQLRFLIRPAKLTHYLLDQTHPKGSGKARFVDLMGFRADRLPDLANALLAHTDRPARALEDNEWGKKVYFVGELETPPGERPVITTIWQYEPADHPFAYLATMLPRPKRFRTGD